MTDNQNVNNVENQEITEQELNEILRVRREKLADMCAAGKNPFEKVKYDFNAYSEDIKAEFKDDEEEPRVVRIAGRIMSFRIMGKASFISVADGKGRIQCYVRINDVGEDVYADFKKWDIGDIVGVEGFVFRTRMGEISIHAQKIEMLAKSLLPLP